MMIGFCIERIAQPHRIMWQVPLYRCMNRVAQEIDLMG